MDETSHKGHDADHHYEERDVPVRPIVIFIGILALLAIVVTLLSGWLLREFETRRTRLEAPPSPLAVIREAPPGPRLEVTVDQVLREVRAEEEALLHSYGWVDPEAGIARIPIDRAMTLLSERGLPSRAEIPGTRTEEQSQ